LKNIQIIAWSQLNHLSFARSSILSATDTQAKGRMCAMTIKN